MLTDKLKIGFVGAGNMAAAIITGLIDNGFPAGNIFASDPNRETRNKLRAQHGINICSGNLELGEKTQAVVLAVKPQVLADVSRELTPLKDKKLFISIAAGKSIKDLQTNLGMRLARVMPNAPALVGKGASVFYTESQERDAQVVRKLFSGVGRVIRVDDEKLLHAVTALSGSGPAYFYYIMDKMTQIGVALGLDEDTARTLVAATAAGAGEMGMSTGKSFTQLISDVSSQGGTTESAMKVLSTSGIDEILSQTVSHAYKRSLELCE